MRVLAFLGMIAMIALVACDKTVTTPAGATLIDLPAIANGAPFAGAPTADFSKKEATYRVKGTNTGGLRIRVEFEHGGIESRAAPSSQPLLAFRAFKVVVVENALWNMSATCGPPTLVDDARAHAPAAAMSCDLVMKRRNGELTQTLRIHVSGNGHCTVTAPKGGDYAVMPDA